MNNNAQSFHLSAIDALSGAKTVVALHVRSFVPAASIVKNTMTLYTLFIVLFSMMIAFPLFYTKDGLFAVLANLGHLQSPEFLYVIGFYIFMTYCAYYSVVAEEMVWSKDEQLRCQVIYPISLICTAIIFVYVEGEEVRLWHALICEAIGRQIFMFVMTSFSVYYSTVNGPSDKSYSAAHSADGKLNVGKCILLYLTGLGIAVLCSIITTVELFVGVIPISLSFLILNEAEKLGIYGFLFPIVRYVVGILMDNLVNFSEKFGVFDGNPQAINITKFTISLFSVLFFSVSPLFCMLFLSPDPLSFAITFLPHAFFSKALWAQHIPQVKAFVTKMSCKLGGNRRIVSSTVDNELISEQDRTRIEEEKKKKEEHESIAITTSGAMQEAGDLVGHIVVIILMGMRLSYLCFFPSGSSTNNSAISLDQFKNLIINIFCVILPVDQITAIFGFALLAQSGHPVDPNFHLDTNPLNPIRTWRNGYRFKAIGSLSFCVCNLLAVCCAVAIGTNGPLW